MLTETRISRTTDGDTITIDAINNTLNLHVSEEELKTRLQEWIAPPPKITRGTLAKYYKLVSDASHGVSVHPIQATLFSLFPFFYLFPARTPERCCSSGRTGSMKQNPLGRSGCNRLLFILHWFPCLSDRMQPWVLTDLSLHEYRPSPTWIYSRKDPRTCLQLI